MKSTFTYSSKTFAFLLFCLFCFSTIVAQTVPVIFPYQGFDIDGNLKANNPTPGIGDWIPGAGGAGQYVFDIDGKAVNTATTYRFTDLFDTTSDDIFNGGKFNEDPNTEWSLTTSKAVGKGDINNVLIHLGVDSNNNQWLIIASDRLETTGTSYIDFEFFQKPLTITNGSFNLAGGRTVNDILLAVEYTNGGSIATVKFYRWNGTDYAIVLDPATNAFGKTNVLSAETMTGKAYGKSIYTEYQFVEAAINISTFLDAIDPCAGGEFGSVLVKTKNSAAASASLNDFAGPYPVKLVLGTAEIIGGGAYCKSDGASKQLTINGVQGGTFSALPLGLVINESGLIDVASSVPATYTVTYSYTTGICEKFVTTEVTIDAAPVISDKPNQSFCNVSLFSMTQSAPSVGVGEWTLINGTATITTASSPTTTVTGVPVGTAATLRWTVTNGTCSAFDEVIIRNNAQPIAAAGTDQTKCNTNSFTMIAVATVGNGAWTFIGTSGLAVIADPTSATTTVNSVPTDMDITLRWTETNANCNSYDDVVIRNNAQPIAAAGVDQAKCNINSFTMAAVPSVGNGAWTFLSEFGTAVITSPTSSTTTVTAVPTNMDITLRWTETNGTCSAFDDVVIRNNEAPAPPISGGSITECRDAQMQTLTAVASVPEGYSIIWYDSPTDGEIVENPTLSTVDTLTYYAETLNEATSCISLTRTPVTLSINDCLIAIVKTNDITVGPNDCATLEVDDVVTYSFSVTNPGNVSLSNVEVLDPHTGLSAIALQSGDLNDDNLLDVTETWVYQATYAVTQADIDNGSITNQASVSGIAPDDTEVTDLSGDSTAVDGDNVILICTTPNIAIVKANDITVGPNGCATLEVDDVVTYSFTVTNPGNVSLHNVTISDPHDGLSAIELQSGDLNTNSVLEVNEIWVYRATYTVTQADIDNGSITNQASVIGIAPDDTRVTDQSGDSTIDNDTNVIPICTTADIAITKDGTYQDTNGDGITNIGDNVIYNFVVTNTGNLTLTNVTVTDNNAVVSGGPLNSLEVGASDSTTFAAIHVITQEDIDAGIVYNLSTATGTPPDAPQVSATSTDPTPCTSCPINEQCPDCTITVLTQTPSIALVKSGVFIDANSDGYAQVGEQINYTFVVSNTGNVSLTNIIITDPLIGLIISGNPIAILAPGATDNTVTGVYSVTQADIDAGLVINSALATAQDPNGNDITDISGTAIDNDTPTETSLSQTPGVALVKTSTFSDTNNDGYPQAGEIINYNFTVTNIGNVLITNIVITDPLVGLIISGNPITSLAPGASNNSANGVYIITQADIDTGSVTNSALVTGNDPLGNDITDISGTTVENNTPTVTDLIHNPGLEVIKTANNENYSSVGDILNYTIQVTNTGNVTLYQIAVIDELTGLSTIIESLAPGSTQEFTENYTVIQSDRENGSVTNTAEADGFTPNETPIHAEDSAIVEAAIVLGCQTILVHNAFSPNGDGINEVFVIDNLEDVLCYPTNSLEIYNRWGVLVFETTNYNSTSNYFNGVSKGRTTVSQSAGLPTGTYFYILNYTSIEGTGGVKNNTKDGYLYLTR